MNLLVEDWGGKYQSHDISAKQGTGVIELLEKVLLEAEVLELTANPNKPALGTVVEAQLDKGRGLSKILMSEIQSQLKIHHENIKALFTESNSDKVDESKDVMNPKLRRQILNRLGFFYLDFDYIQPPLSKESDKCKDLLLSVHKDYLISDKIKSHILIDWLEEFWETLSDLKDLDWIKTKEKLELSKFVNVINNI
jgi:hypothetical protein